MSNDELNVKVNSLLDYKELMAELKKEADALENSIKECLNERGVEELVVGTHIVRNTSVLSSRFDTTRFKMDFGTDVYKAYCKEVASKRFSIA